MMIKLWVPMIIILCLLVHLSLSTALRFSFPVYLCTALNNSYLLSNLLILFCVKYGNQIKLVPNIKISECTWSQNCWNIWWAFKNWFISEKMPTCLHNAFMDDYVIEVCIRTYRGSAYFHILNFVPQPNRLMGNIPNPKWYHTVSGRNFWR